MSPKTKATLSDSQVEGVLERIIFSNEDNAYVVGELRLTDGGKKSRAVTVLGTLPGVQCGETLKLTGEWTTHREHGEQFKIASFQSKLPSSVYGIRKYLGSGLVQGIGPKYADRIVDTFGADTLKVISEESKRLQEVPGIGKERAASIKSAWDDQRAVRDVLMFLQTYGVTTNQCVRLVKRYGSNTRRLLEENPFRLARDIERIGFKTADKIARNLGFPNDSDTRIDAGILYALQNFEEEGHTCIPVRDLVGATAKLLELPGDQITPRLEGLRKREEIVAVTWKQTTRYQLSSTYRAEGRLAEALNQLLATRSSLPRIKIEKAIDWAQQRAGFTFSSGQHQALATLLSSKVSILTGGPGTGKTTILQAVVNILKAKKIRIQLASPTGRAAQRLSDSAGHPAATIHRLLKFDAAKGRFFHGPDQTLPCGVLIVDEASMLDTRLSASLIRALSPAASLIFVGDADQLPSVGAGNVLHDLIQSGRIPVTRLDQIFRQSSESSIVAVAHQVLHGDPLLPYTANLAREINPEADFHFILAENSEAALHKTLALATDFLPRTFRVDPIAGIQVLSPMHRGQVGIQNLNTELQQQLNPLQQARKRPNQSVQQTHFRERSGRTLPAETQYGETTFRIGDKVIQTRNNYDKNLFNGDMGVIEGVAADSRTLSIVFNGKSHEFERSDLGELQLAYAVSVHKSQGSEYPIVLLPLLKQHYMMLQRNLLYTGITRGKQKVFVIGEPEAWQMAVRNRDATLRQTDLLNKLNSNGS